MSVVGFIKGIHTKELGAIEKLRLEDRVLSTEDLRLSERTLENVELHLKVEEILFPALEKIPETSMAVRETAEEHEHLRKMIMELRGLLRGLDLNNKEMVSRLTETITNFYKYLRDHAAQEEEQLFLPALRLLSDEQLRKVSEAAENVLIEAGRKDLVEELRKATIR